MKKICAALLLVLLLVAPCSAEDLEIPKAYPIERYLDGWSKNPFTLKTAPVTLQHDSFAKDLALGSICQIGDAIKVVVINTKTHARTALDNGKDNPGGIAIKSAHFDEFRKGTYVELVMGSDSAVLHYDPDLLKSYTTSGASPSGQPGKAAGPHGVIPPPMPALPTTVQNQTVANVKRLVSANTSAVPTPPSADITRQSIESQIPTPLRKRRLNPPPLPGQ
jgi:hypothetical protein